jgi:mono/diheme cytochrome c family protein
MLKRSSLSVAAGLLLLVTAAACKTNQTGVSNTGSHPSATATPDQFASVRGTYDKECKTCHGPTGAGGPVKLDDGTKLKVPSLREGHAVRHPDSDYVKQITKGGDGMPAFEKKLTPDQMNDLIKMIRQEFQNGPTATK